MRNLIPVVCTPTPISKTHKNATLLSAKKLESLYNHVSRLSQGRAHYLWVQTDSLPTPFCDWLLECFAISNCQYLTAYLRPALTGTGTASCTSADATLGSAPKSPIARYFDSNRMYYSRYHGLSFCFGEMLTYLQNLRLIQQHRATGVIRICGVELHAMA